MADEKISVDRARRRLLQLGVYLTPALLNLTAFLGSSFAQELRVTVGQEVAVAVIVRPRVRADIAPL